MDELTGTISVRLENEETFIPLQLNDISPELPLSPKTNTYDFGNELESLKLIVNNLQEKVDRLEGNSEQALLSEKEVKEEKTSTLERRVMLLEKQMKEMEEEIKSIKQQLKPTVE